MKKKKQTILVVLGVIVALLLCCGSSLFLGVWGFSRLMEESMGVKNDFLHEICVTAELTEDKYQKIFTDDFRDEISYEDAQEKLDKAFPDSYDCSSLQGNLLVMLKNLQRLSVENGVITFSYSVESNSIEFVLIKEDGTYKIDDIDI